MLRSALPLGVATILVFAGCGARTTLRVPREGGDADGAPADTPNDRAEDPTADPLPDPPADPMRDPPGDPPPPPPVWSGITNVSVSSSTVDSEPSIAVDDRGEVVVGWMRIIGGSSQLIYAATAHDGRTFGAPFVLRDLDSVDYAGGDDDISFAPGPGGVLYAAWLGVVGFGGSNTFWSDIR